MHPPLTHTVETPTNWRVERIECLVQEREDLQAELTRRLSVSDRQQLQQIINAQTREIHKLRKDLGWLPLED